jgi:hypothetical protein
MHIWRPPHDAPHLLEWWRPLLLVGRRARAEGVRWPIHLDEFRLAGRVVRSGRPDVWLYEHHENGGTLCVDATGATYRFVFTPNGRGPGQFRSCTLRAAIARAGLPDVVEPVWYGDPPTEPWSDPGGDGSEARDGGRGAGGTDSGRADHPAGGSRLARERRARPGGAGVGGDDVAIAAGERHIVRRGHLSLVGGRAVGA